jgi:hypothetical protein
MRQDSEKQTDGRQQDLREIPKWTRRYAQNRTLPFVVFQLIFIAGAAAFGGLGLSIGWASAHGHRPLAAALVLILCGFSVFWIWLSLFGGLRRLTAPIVARFYRREGEVALSPSAGPATCRRPPLALFLYMFCILAHIGLGFLGVVPARTMQPVSALYFVPFCIYLALKMRPNGSLFMLLWPGLYALHALLLTAGAPIYFGGPYEALNMLLPIAGYGLLAGLASHLYSRLALRRLRVLARSPEVLKTGEGANE